MQYSLRQLTHNLVSALLSLGAIALPLAVQNAAMASVGQPLLQVLGLLENGDATLSDNSLFDKHWFVGRAGETVNITLTSEEFDTYLMVYDANGHRIAQNDDISDANKNSSVTVTLPADGQYRIVANAFNDLGYGHYKLTVVSLPDSNKPNSVIIDAD